MLQQDAETIMSVADLQVAYMQNGQYAAVLDKLSFTLRKGEIVALLGESGSGKSTIAKAVTGLLPPSVQISGGTLRLGNSEMAIAGRKGWERIRGRVIGMLFQDARLALNPLMKIGAHFKECLVFHGAASAGQTAVIGTELLRKLGFERPHEAMNSYPFQLSGGMCQRVCLALALCLKPEVLIADEPTSALDTVSQKEVLDLLGALQRELGLSVLFITHDIAAASSVSSRVIVLNKGAIVEEGETISVLTKPKSPYTRSLLAARAQPAMSFGVDDGPSVGAPLLQAAGLGKSYDRIILRDVSLTLHEGEILGILGQSGSGKSTLAKCIAGLEQPDAGEIWFGGENIVALRGKRRREHCKRLQLVFQDARASLNAGRTALQLVQEPLHYLNIGSRKDRANTASRYLDEVGITGSMQHRKPTELSTGQCQRIAIARALAPGPKLLLCDEAVSALDMSVQSQILDLLQRLQRHHGFAIMMISHDIRVLRTFCHNIAVMDKGRFCEVRRATDLHESRLRHTRLLLKCASDMEAGLQGNKFAPDLVCRPGPTTGREHCVK